MNLYDARNEPRNSPPTPQVATRIDTLLEQVKTLTNRTITSRRRIMQHSQTLGFFEPPRDQASSGAMVEPPIADLQTALSILEREVDHLAAALNVFD